MWEGRGDCDEEGRLKTKVWASQGWWKERTGVDALMPGRKMLDAKAQLREGTATGRLFLGSLDDPTSLSRALEPEGVNRQEFFGPCVKMRVPCWPPLPLLLRDASSASSPRLQNSESFAEIFLVHPGMTFSRLAVSEFEGWA